MHADRQLILLLAELDALRERMTADANRGNDAIRPHLGDLTSIVNRYRAGRTCEHGVEIYLLCTACAKQQGAVADILEGLGLDTDRAESWKVIDEYAAGKTSILTATSRLAHLRQQRHATPAPKKEATS